VVLLFQHPAGVLTAHRRARV